MWNKRGQTKGKTRKEVCGGGRKNKEKRAITPCGVCVGVKENMDNCMYKEIDNKDLDVGFMGEKTMKCHFLVM